MKKLIVILLVIALAAQTVMAQGNFEDYAEAEAKRYKGGGIAMLVGGLAMIGGGAAMMSNDSKYATAMGVGMLTAGVAVDVGSIFMFRKSKQILEDARENEEVPVSFLVSPNGAQFVWRF